MKLILNITYCNPPNATIDGATVNPKELENRNLFIDSVVKNVFSKTFLRKVTL